MKQYKFNRADGLDEVHPMREERKGLENEIKRLKAIIVCLDFALVAVIVASAFMMWTLL